jgi:hypothetical protein
LGYARAGYRVIPCLMDNPKKQIRKKYMYNHTVGEIIVYSILLTGAGVYLVLVLFGIC